METQVNRSRDKSKIQNKKDAEVAKRTCVLVLGMHRSGTSAITRILSYMGATLPLNIMGPSKANETGHWEPAQLVALNENILEELDSSWDNWRPLNLNKLSQERKQYYQTQIQSIIQEEYGEAQLFVLKDPRICRLLPLYSELLNKINIEIKVVAQFRNPIEVMDSLRTRDSMLPSDAALLWLQYNLTSLKDSRDITRIFIKYDDVLQDWRSSHNTITKHLDVNWHYQLEEIEDLVDQFISPKLCHHNHKDEEVLFDPLLRQWVGETYNALLVLQKNPNSKNAFKRLDEIAVEFYRATPMLQQIKKSVAQSYEGIVQDHTQQKHQLQETLTTRDQKLVEKDQLITERDQQLVEKDQLITKRDQQLVEKDQLISERDQQLIEKDELISERDQQLVEKEELITKRDQQLVEKEELISERDQQLVEKEELISERDQQLIEKKELITIRDQRLIEKDQIISERDQQLVEKEYFTSEKIKYFTAELKKQNELFTGSTSWKITSPIRSVKTTQINLFNNFKVLSTLINHFGFFSSIKKTLNVWQSEGFSAAAQRFENAKTITNKHDQTLTSSSIEKLETQQLDMSIYQSYVLKTDETFDFTSCSLKLIAFYLPQYHPIQENDEWWGNGFTEWTNVIKGKPMFPGHYQPHIPGELGYYDLRDKDILLRQTELAKQYGIGGFCFYFYWFAGKTLLEMPVKQFLEREDLDFPFCLCWANENWTRRWDGLENDVLIAQNYSPEDDIRFIEYLSKYLKNKRYIRVDGKPLVIVYRPSELPNAKETSARWRKWCHENGIGDIYLAYTQSFENVDPKEYGFDAAIEFPPNNTRLPDVSSKVPPTVSSFSGNIYNWADLVSRSHDYSTSDYKLFRSVNPGWDNTARKNLNANILTNSSPEGYQTWLTNAISDTNINAKSDDEKLIFINAWNEWAEGAHLEPDQKYGYTYLNATKNALLSSLNISTQDKIPLPEEHYFPIIIHAFYMEIFIEILDLLKNIDHPIHLFISTTYDKQNEINEILKDTHYRFTIRPFENRGRDVLPFLDLLRLVHSYGYDKFLKLHTKKSLHRNDGNMWRDDIFSQLLNPSNFNAVVQAMNTNSDIGLIGPKNHIIPMSQYWGSNADTVLDLAHQMKFPNKFDLNDQFFVAGTMFYARIKALLPLINIRINKYDFEEEQGQVDGTLAHAIERAISLSCQTADCKMLSIHDILNSSNSTTLSFKDTYDFAD